MAREMQGWLANAIHAERAAQRMSIKSLGLASGIPERTLIRILNCERDLNVGQLAKLAGALGVLPSYLQTEAERRQTSATPQQRAAVLIQADETLTQRQKTALLGEHESDNDDVSSSPDDLRGGGNHHA